MEPDVGSLAALGLLPTRPDWAAGLRETWEPGEPAARAALAAFLDDPVQCYGRDRGYPAKSAVSRLSPRLRHGELSPRQVWRAAQAHSCAGTASFIRELIWREFSYHLGSSAQGKRANSGRSGRSTMSGK